MPGALTNKLVLTKENPLGDVAFGVDNTFASRALDEGVFAPSAATLPEGADDVRARRRRRPGVLDAWSTTATCASTSTTPGSPTTASRRRSRPRRPARSPAYQDLFVTPSAPTTSSPGMAFLLGHGRGVRRRLARTTGPT